MNPCVVKISTLFEASVCEHEGTIYDRARKGWLCRDHAKERLCEFCHAEKGWAWIWYQGMDCYPWLCLSCAGVRGMTATTRLINKPGKG
jgi:hypothetical protein